jgi:hypothetical protein
MANWPALQRLSGRVVSQESLAAEILMIRVIGPPCANHFVAEIEGVLQNCEAGPVDVHRAKLLFQEALVDRPISKELDPNTPKPNKIQPHNSRRFPRQSHALFLRPGPLPPSETEHRVFDVPAAPFRIDLASPEGLFHFPFKPMSSLSDLFWRVGGSLHPIKHFLKPLKSRWY